MQRVAFALIGALCAVRAHLGKPGTDRDDMRFGADGDMKNYMLPREQNRGEPSVFLPGRQLDVKWKCEAPVVRVGDRSEFLAPRDIVAGRAITTISPHAWTADPLSNRGKSLTQKLKFRRSDPVFFASSNASTGWRPQAAVQA